jgi:hypothetical protein
MKSYTKRHTIMLTLAAWWPILIMVVAIVVIVAVRNCQVYFARTKLTHGQSQGQR